MVFLKRKEKMPTASHYSLPEPKNMLIKKRKRPYRALLIKIPKANILFLKKIALPLLFDQSRTKGQGIDLVSS